MKILLTAINAKYIHANLAVYSLRAYAKEYREQISLLECTINQRVEEILEKIYKEKPDVLCFSCYIWNISYVKELIQEIKMLRPDLPIWVGGPEVSYEVEMLLKENPQIDGVIIGEGEQTFCEICRCYVAQSQDLETAICQVRGVAYRKKSGEIIYTEMQQPLDMDTIPFVYNDMESFKNRIIYYESSRGCPFSCSYCLSSVDKRLRFRSLELVKKELAFFIEKEVPQVKFVDRTFNCNHQHAMEIWRFIKEKDRGITNFHFEVAADLLNEEELALISDMRPGLIQLEIGVQSTNEATITEIHRHMDLNEVKETVRSIQKAGNIHQHLDLIAGLPEEDYLTFAKSFDEIYALKPEQLQLGFLKVLKGSYLFEHAKEYGMLYKSEPPYEIMETKWLPYEDVLKIKLVEEMLEVYYNSGQFEITMKVLELAFSSAFFMFLKLGMFYEEKGYRQIRHTRNRRCEILLEFIRIYDKEHEELYRQTLTMDLYYRENMKTRPGFAKDLAEYKNVSRHYCPKGEQKHLEPCHYTGLFTEQRTLTEYPEECKEYYAVFDYANRSRLTNQAEIQIYNADGEKERGATIC